MAQVTSGLRAVLSSPVVYAIFQDFMGASKARKQFVSEFVDPYSIVSVLDIGCGPADILEHMTGIQYFGFDISESYIAKARSRYGEKGHFFAKYLTQEDLVTLPKFDMAIMMGVLHHLNDDEACNVLRIVREALHPTGRLVTKDPVFEEGQNPIARFLISKDRGQNVRTRQGYEALFDEVFHKRKATIRHKKWPPYTHCIVEAAW